MNRKWPRSIQLIRRFQCGQVLHDTVLIFRVLTGAYMASLFENVEAGRPVTR